MLKLAGWILTPTAVEEWFAHHPDVQKSQVSSAAFTELATSFFVQQRRQKSFPISDRVINSVCYPKITPQAHGTVICILVRFMKEVQGEDLENFTPIHMTEKNKQFRELLFQDGLKEELEWITIPDPFEYEWPFARRFPGKLCPPEPPLVVISSDVVDDGADEGYSCLDSESEDESDPSESNEGESESDESEDSDESDSEDDDTDDA